MFSGVVSRKRQKGKGGGGVPALKLLQLTFFCKVINWKALGVHLTPPPLPPHLPQWAYFCVAFGHMKSWRRGITTLPGNSKSDLGSNPVSHAQQARFRTELFILNRYFVPKRPVSSLTFLFRNGRRWQAADRHASKLHLIITHHQRATLTIYGGCT